MPCKLRGKLPIITGMRQPLREAMQDPMPPGERSANSRAFRRYGVTLPVVVCPLVQEEELPRGRRARRATALVTNISLSGLTFLSPTTYLPGTRLSVQIALGAHTYVIEAVVRRGQYVALPGRRAWQCAAQILRGDEAVRFIPRLAHYLYARGTREQP